MNKKTAIVYLAAGISSRFSGKIKSLAEVGQNRETLMEISMKQAIPFFSEIIIIIGDKTEPIKNYFRNEFRGVPIFYAKQIYDEKERDKPWGTVDALCSAKELIDCDFVVCNGDDLYGTNAFNILAEHLKKNEEDATLGYRLSETLPENGAVNRGIFQIENDYVNEIKEIKNIDKKNLNLFGLKEDELCSMNIFALKKESLNYLNEKLAEFKEKNRNDRKIECYLSEEISKLINEEKMKMKMYNCGEKWLGITNPGDEEIVKRELFLREL